MGDLKIFNIRFKKTTELQIGKLNLSNGEGSHNFSSFTKYTLSERGS